MKITHCGKLKNSATIFHSSSHHEVESVPSSLESGQDSWLTLTEMEQWGYWVRSGASLRSLAGSPFHLLECCPESAMNKANSAFWRMKGLVEENQGAPASCNCHSCERDYRGPSKLAARFGPLPNFVWPAKIKFFIILMVRKIKRRRIVCDMWKSHKIQILESTNKALWEHNHTLLFTYCLWLRLCCNGRLNICDRDQMAIKT